MTDTFRTYDSIDNHYNNKYVDTILNHSSFDANAIWVATEKVHGSNFSFTVISEDGNLNFKVGTRSQYLEEGASFLGNASKVVTETYKPLALKAFNYVTTDSQFTEKYPNTFKVSIYGEIFGGSYPHAEVKKAPKASVVQKGVYYCPHNDFYPFDILVEYKRGDESLSAWFNFDEFTAVMKKCEFPIYAKEIFRGTLSQCLEQDVEFTSVISSLYNLPPLESNITEGLVIKPLEPFTDSENGRWIIKKKSQGFNEIAAPSKDKTPVEKKAGGLAALESEVGKKAMEIASRYVTENRLQNVRSKLVDDFVTNPSSIGKAVFAFTTDAMKDFEKDNEELWKSKDLKKNEQNVIKKNVGTLCGQLLKAYVEKAKSEAE